MPTNRDNPQGNNRGETRTPGTPAAGSGGRGFAGMDQQQQRKIAQKGGEAVSRDRQHMSDIGRRGGEASGGNRGGGNR